MLRFGFEREVRAGDPTGPGDLSTLCLNAYHIFAILNEGFTLQKLVDMTLWVGAWLTYHQDHFFIPAFDITYKNIFLGN